MVLNDVVSLVHSISGRPANKRSYHLALVVYHCCQIPLYNGFCLEQQIYPLISHETGLSTNTISRNIARATIDCWEYGDRKKLERIAGRPLSEKPSPKEFVLYLCAYLTGCHDIL